ncbi:MAG: N-acyl-D-amino-acid deacylase family protein, partial [Longimicrobiales bacterium]
LILRGATVYDGTGAAGHAADVAVGEGRILEIGASPGAAGAEVVDLGGLALAPGFVDIHSHTDLSLLVDARAESKIRQGCTTEVSGQDGGSIGPWSDAAFEDVRASYRERYGVEIDFRDPGGFLDRIGRERVAVNVATMVGAGTVRAAVVGADDRPATDAELARMVALVREALGRGACGLSSGLEYTPGGFATLAELAALAGPLRGTGLPYASHMRNEDDHLLAAIEEALNVGRAAGVPVQISHLKTQGERNWWKVGPVLELLEAARADGLDVLYDRYPYIAYSTGLSNLFPLWTRDGGTDAFTARLQDPALRGRIEAAVREKIEQLGSWDSVQITGTAADELAWARGQRLGELARAREVDPYELLLSLMLTDRGRTGMVGFGMSEQNTARFLAHPLGMVCSDSGARALDGPLSGGSPHPRTYGTFPRVLGHYVRERGVMPLETAVHKMTWLPASRVGLLDRGRIAPGAAADLVAFDPAEVDDRATFENPHQYPVGIQHVLVAGEFVLRDGRRTGALPGRPLRPLPR